MKVKITGPARKDLRKIEKKIRDKIGQTLNQLRQGEFNFRKLTSKKNEWKIRVGDYRVVIEIDKEIETIFVIRVKHRRDVYR